MPAAARLAFAYRARLRAMAFAPYFTPAANLAPDLAKHLIDCVGPRATIRLPPARATMIPGLRNTAWTVPSC